MPITIGGAADAGARKMDEPWALGNGEGPKGGLILAAPGTGTTTFAAAHPGKVVEGDTFAWKGLNLAPGWSKTPQADKIREAARAAVLRYSGPEAVLFWDPALVPWADAVVAIPDRQLSQQIDTAKPQEKARREGMSGKEAVLVQEQLRAAANSGRVPVYSTLEEAVETVVGASVGSAGQPGKDKTKQKEAPGASAGTESGDEGEGDDEP